VLTAGSVRFCAVRRFTYATTPVGEVLLTGDGCGSLVGLHWPAHHRAPKPARSWTQDASAFAAVREQLGEYFAGTRTAFDLPLAAPGTPFQQRVWAALREIPYGETVTYGALAAAIGRPGAARAVGLANGGNPLSLVVPCHRVVGATGGLTGYAGGVDVKSLLLAFEARARSRYSEGTTPWWRRNALANCAGSR
jgi:methylated-DNA-[protein]-cysteine S-methyltransferase